MEYHPDLESFPAVAAYVRAVQAEGGNVGTGFEEAGYGDYHDPFLADSNHTTGDPWFDVYGVSRPGMDPHQTDLTGEL